MGARMREMDWSKTPLGPADTWPQSLRSTVSMLLPSKAQIILFWGPEFSVALQRCVPSGLRRETPARARSSRSRRHGARSGTVMLHELLAGVVRTGEAFWAKDLLFEVERYGFLEETYFDVSYDPVRVESGEVGGVYCIVTETTERVVGERRLALLKDLAERNATARTARDACVLATETLAAKPQDVLFALAYLGDELQSCTPGAREQLAGVEARAGQGALHLRRRALRREPADSSSASIRGARSTINTARSWTSSPTSSERRSPTRARTSRNESAPKRWRSSIARKRRSSATSVTSSARRSPCSSDRSKTAWPMRRRRCRPCIGNGRRSRIAMPCDCCGS